MAKIETKTAEVTVKKVYDNGKVVKFSTEEGKDFVISKKKELPEIKEGKYRVEYNPVTDSYKGKESITRWVQGFTKIDSNRSDGNGIVEGQTGTQSKLEFKAANANPKVNWDEKDAWSRRQTAAKCATELAVAKAEFFLKSETVALTKDQFDQEVSQFWNKWFEKVYRDLTLVPGKETVEVIDEDEPLPF